MLPVGLVSGGGGGGGGRAARAAAEPAPAEIVARVVEPTPQAVAPSRPKPALPPKPVPPRPVSASRVESGAGTGEPGVTAGLGSGPGSGGGTGGGTGAGTGPGSGSGSGEARVAYGQNPPPLYPLAARRLGIEGVVELRVLVTPDGHADDVHVVSSSGHAMLDESAVATVRSRWRFVPAQRDGVPVADYVRFPIRFRLSDGGRG